MSTTTAEAGAQAQAHQTVSAVLAAIRSALDAGDGTNPVDDLRILAVLGPVLERAAAGAARGTRGSPVRAAAFAHLAERSYRVAGYAQLLAAGACLEADAHTCAEEPLAELHALLDHAEAFAAGTVDLPADKTVPAGRKLLHRDPADLLKTMLKLTHFQAKHRVESYAKLLPHRGPDGRPVEPEYPRLGKVLEDASADPRLVANTASKLGAMAPALSAQPNPAASAAQLEAVAAQAVAEHDAGTVGRMLREANVRLDESAIERDEDAIRPYLGLRFRGRKPTGYLWELTCDAEGNELLTTLADDLNNPRTASGDACRAGTGTPHAAAGSGPAVGREPRPIPEWAVDPGLPPDQRPIEGFSDVGRPAAVSDRDPLPGESPAEANARVRARRLLQAVLDALRTGTNPARAGDPQLPMGSRVEMLVVVDYDSLTGATEAPALTGHGDYLAAATARRLACNAGILPLVMGGNSQPLDLGRKRRFFTKGQKRAIAARDRGCINPGCSMAVNRTEAHHVDPWSEGGRTRVNNGVLLCVGCHTAHHAGHFAIEFHRGIPYVVQPASRDPLRRPVRNWVFHPDPAAA
ncbi:DUF222 domain-containing protein [Paeniglutamicibacter sp. R2-26]|uniref:HNH endonuclease signature motif containing protein n=1 Tax=Paeniglutamicibacter sp. R2-26 TaxID=3144417 RepID=UPI003EE7925A